MKRLAALMAVVGVLLLLVACANSKTVEEMLRAPLLTADQLAVRDALKAYAGDPVTLKTPLSGDRRAPIQFVDLDGDGVNEATAFYTTPQFTTVQFAVLRLINGQWEVTGAMNGLDTEVESVYFLSMALNAGRLVLVQWSSPNSREHRLSPYRFENGQLVAGLEERGTNLLVYDLNNDGYDEFLYVVQDGASFRLKYMNPSAEEDAASMRVIPLNSAMNSCLGLTVGLLADGSRAVFIDEGVTDRIDLASDERYQITEVLVFQNETFAPVEADLNIGELSRRPETSLSCRQLYEDDYVYIPSSNPPFAGVASNLWTYWYTINNGKAEYKAATYVDQRYNFALSVPTEWLGGVSISHESGSQLWEIYGLGVAEEPVLSIRVLTIGESAEEYTGYQTLKQFGSYRFIVKGWAGIDADLDYIKENFIIF